MSHNYELSEATLRAFLETLIRETKAGNIKWEERDLSKTGIFNPASGKSKYMAADIDTDTTIFLNPDKYEFFMAFSNSMYNQYILKEEDSKYIFEQLYNMTIPVSVSFDKYKSNGFILDFIRTKDIASSKKYKNKKQGEY